MSTKVAIVTGGIKGTGKEIIKQFIDRGVNIITIFRKDVESAEKFKKEMETSGVTVDVFQADMGVVEDVNKLFDFAKEKYGHLDYFIANAAATAFKPLADIKPHHVEKTFAITVTGFIVACQRASELMKGRKGKIVAISGYDTHTYLPRHGVLGAAKAAMETLVKYFGVELAPLGISVNAVNPGFLATQSTQIYMGPFYDKIKQANESITPMGGVTGGKEIADVVTFLCSEESRWICGQTIRADGGLSHIQPLALPED
ncbi:SDR family oxidoreductase [bacterium]|nr:SDR family oxidoreductase [bacterium]